MYIVITELLPGEQQDTIFLSNLFIFLYSVVPDDHLLYPVNYKLDSLFWILLLFLIGSFQTQLGLFAYTHFWTADSPTTQTLWLNWYQASPKWTELGKLRHNTDCSALWTCKKVTKLNNQIITNGVCGQHRHLNICDKLKQQPVPDRKGATDGGSMRVEAMRQSEVIAQTLV